MLKLAHLAGATLVAGLLVGAGGLLSPAAACSNDGTDCGGDGDGDGDTSSSGGTVTVTVNSTFRSPGSGGSGGSSSSTVSVPIPCYYTPYYTGAELFEYVDSGLAESDYNRVRDGSGDYQPYQPPAGWRAHKNDPEADGEWYGGICESVRFDGDLDAFFDYAQQWFDDHDYVWVPDGDQPPVPPIPPEVLLDAALNEMEIPEPAFERNPEREGDGSSIVNLETWFWQAPGTPDAGTVSATAGPNNVTVQVDLDDVTYRSPDAGEVICADGGTPYSPGAASDCVLVFPSPGETTVSADSTWNGSWAFNGTPQGQIEPVFGEWETALGVAEIQSLVTDVD